MMSRNDVASDIPSTGCDIARNSGATSATAMFICIVYEMSDAELPPKRAVITAAAVAVGHSRHIMAASSSTRTVTGICGRMAMVNDIAMNENIWNESSHRCHFDGFSSFTFTLQNVTKSIANMSPG